MRLKSGILGAAAAAGLVFGISQAQADTVTVDGITMPVGVSQTGIQFQSVLIDENVVTAVGQTLIGAGYIQNIVDPLNNATWTQGQNGVNLFVVFGGPSDTNPFTVSSISGTNITFTGGNAQYYVVPSSIPVSSLVGGSGSAATDIQNIMNAGKLWLNVKAATSDALGNTLSAVAFAGSFLAQFNAAGAAYFDTTSDIFGAGDANANLDTNDVANPFDATACATGPASNCSDALFTETFNDLTAPPGYFVSGTATVKTNAIPEPASLSLLGSGLLAFGLAKRKLRRKAA